MVKTKMVRRFILGICLVSCMLFSGVAASAQTVDTIPPSAPEQLVFNHNTNVYTLAWKASTDNVGVTGYYLTIRSSTGESSVYQTTQTGWGYVGPMGPAYSISVVAVDAAGNRSQPALLYIPAFPNS